MNIDFLSEIVICAIIIIASFVNSNKIVSILLIAIASTIVAKNITKVIFKRN